MKYYFLFFLIFCLIIGGGIYTLSPTDISITLFSWTLSLPLSLWIIYSAGIFFIASLGFFGAYWITQFLRRYHLDRDVDRFIHQIQDQILQKEVQNSYKTQTFKTLSKILNRARLEPLLETPQSQNTSIDELFKDLSEVEKGHVSKSYFQANTYFWTKNTQNRIDSDPKFAQKVLEGEYARSLKQYAAVKIAQSENLSEKLIQKLIAQDLDQTGAQSILECLLDKGYKLGKEELLKILIGMDSKTLIKYFKHYKNSLDPDFWINIFSELAKQKKELRNVYLYVLLDFSMFDKAKDFLNEHEDLILPQAYIELKELGKNYPFNHFFV